MPNILLQQNRYMKEFYEIPNIKKRLESGDFVRGAFELAYYDAQRTLRGIGKNPHRREIKQGIFEIVSEFYGDVAKNFKYYSLKDFDGTHLLVCNKIIACGEKFGHNIFFGQAQKIVNMFFKYVLLVDDRLNLHINYFHVPFDEVILNGIANGDYPMKIRSYAGACLPWSKITDYNVYMSLQEELRHLYECPILFEFEVWGKWKAQIN